MTLISGIFEIGSAGFNKSMSESAKGWKLSNRSILMPSNLKALKTYVFSLLKQLLSIHIHWTPPDIFSVVVGNIILIKSDFKSIRLRIPVA